MDNQRLNVQERELSRIQQQYFGLVVIRLPKVSWKRRLRSEWEMAPDLGSKRLQRQVEIQNRLGLFG